jgi:hypothetical protein
VTIVGQCTTVRKTTIIGGFEATNEASFPAVPKLAKALGVDCTAFAGCEDVQADEAAPAAPAAKGGKGKGKPKGKGK